MDYLSYSQPQLLSELSSIVESLISTLDDLAYIKINSPRSPEHYNLEAKRDILTEKKYLIVRILEHGFQDGQR